MADIKGKTIKKSIKLYDDSGDLVVPIDDIYRCDVFVYNLKKGPVDGKIVNYSSASGPPEGFDRVCTLGASAIDFYIAEAETEAAGTGTIRIDVKISIADTDYPDGYKIIRHSENLDPFVDSADM